MSNNPSLRFAPISLPAYQKFSSPRELSFSIPLLTTTPTLGGGTEARKVDKLEGVRVPGIRGQLRFWWRAVFAGSVDSVKTLSKRERDLWGGIGSKPEEIRASRASIAVRVTSLAREDTTDVTLQQPDAYALWTARGTRKEEPAARRAPGTKLDLDVRVNVEDDTGQTTEVEYALRTWLLFGGIGGRVRRGCGAVALSNPGARATWLPPDLKQETLHEWLGIQPKNFEFVPGLHGARYQFGPPVRDPLHAWYVAISWLRDFRQAADGKLDTSVAGDFARQRPSLASGNAGRPGRTRWPEPDKLRHLAGPPNYDHAPLVGHGPTPSWPRAELGLPIEVRFQAMDRSKLPFHPRPPHDAKLGWTDKRPSSGAMTVEAHDRLASPLIIKPVQLRDGTFVPFALWLSRRLPTDAQAGVHSSKDALDVRSLAPFGIALPAGDKHLFNPLSGKTSLRDAFMDWVARSSGINGGKL